MRASLSDIVDGRFHILKMKTFRSKERVGLSFGSLLGPFMVSLLPRIATGVPVLYLSLIHI